MRFDTELQLHRHVATLIMAGSLCACASDPFRPLADAVLGPRDQANAIGIPHAPTLAKEPYDTGSCGEVANVVATDVDTAYARVMSRLHFRTTEERKRFAEQYSSGLIDEGFRHTAQPGSYYRLADIVGWQEPNGARDAAWLEVELIRDGPARTRFAGSYCLPSADPHHLDRSFRNSLERRLLDSVR